MSSKQDKLNILFIGVGPDQLVAIHAAMELGLGVYGFDGNPEAAGKKFLDWFECVDIRNPDLVEKAALKLNKQVGIDGCMCPGTEFGPSAGRVIDKLGLIGIGEKTAIDLTDKIRRRIRLDELAIPQPRWGYREEKKANEWNIFPCVVKPRNASAAVGVRLVKTFDEVGLNYDLLEGFLEGWEISTEVLVFSAGQFMSIKADRNYDKKLKYAPYL
ncbi:MAG: hypothetical protein Q7S13_00165, partial [Candidatus Omnitrophota bacterium]|nr:hypothetical protein [Candidatus Omnitrophota bacterium]